MMASHKSALDFVHNLLFLLGSLLIGIMLCYHLPSRFNLSSRRGSRGYPPHAEQIMERFSLRLEHML